LRFLARLAGFAEKFRKPSPERSAEYLRVNAGVTYLGNNEKARQELGIQMRPLKEGLRETLLLEMEKMGMKPPAPAA
jgi:dihydroflavonol-4-reductase